MWIPGAWDTTGGIMTTEQGLMLWTHTYAPGGHIFRKLQDNELWMWGF